MQGCWNPTLHTARLNRATLTGTRQVNTPPAKTGGSGLRLKAGSVDHAADWAQLFAK